MVKKILTEDEYREALNRFLEICNVQNNPAVEDELFTLIEKLEEYEKNNCS